MLEFSNAEAKAEKGAEVAMYLIVIEKANGNFSAYSPDLPGCVATGKTRAHGLLEDKLPIPKPRSSAEYMAFR